MSHAQRVAITLVVVGWVALVDVAAAVRVGPLPLVSLVASAVLALSAYLLSREPEHARVARLLWLAAALNAVGELGGVGSGWDRPSPLGEPLGSWLAQLARAGRWWAVTPLAAVVLLYPGQRLQRIHGWLLGALALVFVGVQGLEALAFDRRWIAEVSPWPSWVTLIPGNEAARIPLYRTANWGGAALAAVATVFVVARWRSATGSARHAVRSVSVAGILLSAGLTAQLVTLALGPDDLGLLSYRWEGIATSATLVLLALVPVGLFLEAMRRRVEQVRLLDDLLGAGGDPVLVQSVLRRSLDDPSLSLSFDLHGDQVDVHGEPLPAGDPEVDRQRLRYTVTGGSGVAAATIDAAEGVNQDPALLRTVLQAAAVVLDNARLQASLASRMRELAASRARIVEAGMLERRQVERDLHDGAQQQLLAVAATLARAGLSQEGAVVQAAVADARVQLGSALAELRRLARGIHPAVLSQGGLSAALPTLAETSSVPLSVVLADGMQGARFGEAVETTAWFIAAESVANTAKHADASQVAVTLRVTEAGPEQTLVLQVCDDGVGGAAVSAGGGLAGLLDRAAALGGTLTLTSSPGRGTTVEAVLPCAS